MYFDFDMKLGGSIYFSRKPYETAIYIRKSYMKLQAVIVNVIFQFMFFLLARTTRGEVVARSTKTVCFPFPTRAMSRRQERTLSKRGVERTTDDCFFASNAPPLFLLDV